jgi:hypothetical protein
LVKSPLNHHEFPLSLPLIKSPLYLHQGWLKVKSPENHNCPPLHRNAGHAFGFHPLEEAVNHRHGETDRILALASWKTWSFYQENVDFFWGGSWDLDAFLWLI